MVVQRGGKLKNGKFEDPPYRRRSVIVKERGFFLTPNSFFGTAIRNLRDPNGLGKCGEGGKEAKSPHLHSPKRALIEVERLPLPLFKKGEIPITDNPPPSTTKIPPPKPLLKSPNDSLSFLMSASSQVFHLISACGMSRTSPFGKRKWKSTKKRFGIPRFVSRYASSYRA